MKFWLICRCSRMSSSHPICLSNEIARIPELLPIVVVIYNRFSIIHIYYKWWILIGWEKCLSNKLFRLFIQEIKISYDY
jgi:hypothetical protein